MICPQALTSIKQQLAQHPLYRRIDSPEALRTFMAHHVFCVWDFMSLVKSLQLNLTGCRLPWLPPANMEVARLINEIILDEETDWIEGRPISHFQLYLEAMAEVGCNLAPIQDFIGLLQANVPLNRALQEAAIPAAARTFVATTFEILQEPPEVQAAVFFHAREDIIPRIFIEMIQNLQNTGLDCRLLLLYLERHVSLDSEEHGPRAEKILQQLFAKKPELAPWAEEAVDKALRARLNLWNELAIAVS